MKKLMCSFLVFLFLFIPHPVLATETCRIYPYDIADSDFWYTSAATPQYNDTSDAKATLLMEYSTGRILFAKNEKDHLPIASVTKVISTLLVMEAIDSNKISLTDNVTISEYAASMGGSQVFLEPGETMSVEDLLKSLVVVSANDATVALGEYLCGSEAAFVKAMNDRAKELGCENSNFVNTNGLPAENHYSCALDVAIITRELMNHKKIFDYTNIWMDTIRNGSFGLANTNKLIRYYSGATGMKTGFTDEAKYCLSATAKRNDMELIAVVLGASTSDIRFSTAKSLLDYGFANYYVQTPEIPYLEPLKVKGGITDYVNLTATPQALLSEKGAGDTIETKIILEESAKAPISKGQEMGYISYVRSGEEIAKSVIYSAEQVDAVTYSSLLSQIFSKLFFR